jgi:hypothetical protein
MAGYFAPMDPRGDVSRMTGGNLAQALGRIKAKTFVMPVSHDMFFPPADCQAEQQLIRDSEFRPLTTIDGHIALFGMDPALRRSTSTWPSCWQAREPLKVVRRVNRAPVKRSGSPRLTN